MNSISVADALESAKKQFLVNFPEGPAYDFSKFPTIEHVYQAAEQLQKEQADSRTMRNLRKIQPFLECLRHYSQVVEMFVQVKPDVLALIWGPVKFLLLVSSTYVRSYDIIVDTLAQIGTVLPAFNNYAKLFPGNGKIQQVLCLFYTDILDFYATLLGFFKQRKWGKLFESLWPRSAGRIQVIINNIMQHRTLIDGEVALENVTGALAARKRALEEYERQHDFQQRQDFEAVMGFLSPRLYNQDLERFKRDCNPQCGSWLQKRDLYCRWLDPADETTKLLCLQGIPGAGKTFLTSVIARRIESREDPVAFAFLSYRFREDLTTLKVLHSLVIQLVLGQKRLQPILITAYDKNYRQLNSSVDFAKGLLRLVLDGLPMTFILLDGLDEMLETERVLLLRVMLELVNDHDNLKVLFSSRPEDDISRFLARKVSPIRVHDGNAEDIEAYVDTRASSWLLDLPVSAAVASEIRVLMRKVALHAEGMFLYARLVCDTIVSQGDIHGVKYAVEHLPNGLDEAYGRILSRITDELGERERKQAEQLLTLVFCSLVPLSKNELQLAVFVGQGGSPSLGLNGLFLNILQRCGPIIEEVDGYIQFVHFSVQEYLRSPQSNSFLEERRAHRCLASISVEYLRSSCFDPELHDKGLTRNILSGAYALENYICTHWVQHLKNSATTGIERLEPSIWKMVQTRRTLNFAGDQAAEKDLDPFILYGSASRDLANALIFSRKRSRDLSFSEEESLAAFDPFTFSGTQLRVRQLLESMLCETRRCRENCSCGLLRTTYGDKIYKCARPGCPFFRIGFDTRAKRDSHIRTHSRPYKCDFGNCPFSHLGFRTEALMKAHFIHLHSQAIAKVGDRPNNKSKKGQLKVMLLDAVREDDLQTIKDMREEVGPFTFQLLSTAIQERCSEELVYYLVGCLPVRPDGSIKSAPRLARVLSAAIEQENCAVFRTINIQELATSFKNERKMAEIIGAAATKRCPDLVEVIWPQIPPPMYPDFLARLIPWRPNEIAEISALECLHRLKIHPPFQRCSNMALRELGGRCCSIPLASFLLENGASAGGPTDTGHAPIFAASGHDTMQAAEFMRFLLQRGASPGTTYLKQKLEDRPGPKNIHKWLGVTWDELVYSILRTRQDLDASRTMSLAAGDMEFDNVFP